MVKYGTRIVHCLVLLITGIALMGVNVQQLYCCHSDNTHWEVRILPEEEHCPCEGRCCQEKGCDDNNSRHDFYKITDFSKIETCYQIEQIVFDLPVHFQMPELLICPKVDCDYHIDQELSRGIPISQELLCTYLC